METSPLRPFEKVPPAQSTQKQGIKNDQLDNPQLKEISDSEVQNVTEQASDNPILLDKVNTVLANIKGDPISNPAAWIRDHSGSKETEARKHLGMMVTTFRKKPT